jgi:NAD(P)-dependent dehydrogenase (short-subunit alcohol dehydrogenase family)
VPAAPAECLGARWSPGGRVTTIRANLVDPAPARRLVQRTARALGGLDVLVNNAAIFDRTPFATTTPARYDRLLGLNLRAAFFSSREPAAVMRRRRRRRGPLLRHLSPLHHRPGAER